MFYFFACFTLYAMIQFPGMFVFSDSFDFNFTAIFNCTKCPLPGKYPMDMPFKLSFQDDEERFGTVTKRFQITFVCTSSQNTQNPVNNKALEGAFKFKILFHYIFQCYFLFLLTFLRRICYYC